MGDGEKDDIKQEKRNQDAKNYVSSGVSSDWQFCSTNITNAPTVDLPGPPALWDQPTSVQNVGYCDLSLQNNFSSLNPLGSPKFGLGPASLRGDVSWNPPASVLKEGLLLPNAPGTLPESLTQFPADSGFIKRAARFSCFSVGGFSDMVSPFANIEGIGVRPRGVSRMPVPMQGEIFPIDSGNLLPPQGNIINTAKACNDAVLSSMPENCKVGQLKTELESDSLIRSNDEQSKQVASGSGNGSDEPKVSGGVGQDGKEEKGFRSEKRKRKALDAKFDAKAGGQPTESVKDINGTQRKIDQSPNSTSVKAAGKNGKHRSQASEHPKEEYIRVRVQRGHATDSHSLAERVRREKISERMKLLQDLVPGCSKLTGKAVILDEIINYVQSLQLQVEFLAMKHATVNPRLDFNIEELLAKNILHSRAGPSSTLGFFPNMQMPFPPPVHPPPAAVVQAGISGTWSPNSPRRNIHNQMNPVGGGGFKESAQAGRMSSAILFRWVLMGVLLRAAKTILMVLSKRVMEKLNYDMATDPYT